MGDGDDYDAIQQTHTNTHTLTTNNTHTHIQDTLVKLTRQLLALLATKHSNNNDSHHHEQGDKPATTASAADHMIGGIDHVVGDDNRDLIKPYIRSVEPLSMGR